MSLDFPATWYTWTPHLYHVVKAIVPSHYPLYGASTPLVIISTTSTDADLDLCDTRSGCLSIRGERFRAPKHAESAAFTVSPNFQFRSSELPWLPSVFHKCCNIAIMLVRSSTPLELPFVQLAMGRIQLGMPVDQLRANRFVRPRRPYLLQPSSRWFLFVLARILHKSHITSIDRAFAFARAPSSAVRVLCSRSHPTV